MSGELGDPRFGKEFRKRSLYGCGPGYRALNGKYLINDRARCLINLAKSSLRITAINHVLAALFAACADGCTDLAQGGDLQDRSGGWIWKHSHVMSFGKIMQ
jgi:hypothetical protein